MKFEVPYSNRLATVQDPVRFFREAVSQTYVFHTQISQKQLM